MASRLPYPVDHATHLPILIGLGELFPIKSVFEFGAGIYSTPLFLNQQIFPHASRVTSVEPEMEWRNKVCDVLDDQGIGYGGRLEFIDSEEHYFPENYDLVLVDNGPEKHKIQTIRNMAELLEDGTLVVVHDAEHLPYLEEIKKFRTYFIINGMNPETAICANANFGETLSTLAYRIGRVIAENSNLDSREVKAWKELMHG